MRIDQLIGMPIATLLGMQPFARLKPVRTEIEDAVPPYVSYEFEGWKTAIYCDAALDERINTLFVEEAEKLLIEKYFQIPYPWTRDAVIQTLGSPEASGNPGKVEGLSSRYGPWDRFTFGRNSVHFEYHVDGVRVKRITLMSRDVTP